MPTVDERLRHVTLKVKRAKEHVADLERQTRASLTPTRIKSEPSAIRRRHGWVDVSER